ncbi:MAG: iron transporter ATP-binding protein [Gammaproteobacteria bacterium]|jgi:phospholipid/cholesterol/gamma-HCH transport system ATP-binding protein|nr:iron transporter ATP-binding protein [Gammaproteobacteria bacterium]
MPNPIIDIRDLCTEMDGQVIHQGLDFTVYPQEIVAIVGGSGAGKTTLLNCLLMLIKPAGGSINILGKNVNQLSDSEKDRLRMNCGMLFQGGALFSELDVLHNVLFPMLQHSSLDRSFLEKLALLKVLMAGLPDEAAAKYPADLSGGMIKRAALARALALDPPLLFLDEPSAGLDPINASALDKLILELRASLGLTIVLVTHDLDTLATVPDRIAFIGDKKVLAFAPLKDLLGSNIPEVKAYFDNARAKRAFGAEEKCDN